MRFLFLCSCLEAGRDGVGDYTRLFARELIRNGHQAILVALHDRFVTGASIQVERSDGGSDIVRVPTTLPWPTRVEAVTAWSHGRAALGFAPSPAEPIDWVSWQFVSYGYHPKGFVPAALKQLARAIRWIPQHIMCHELWIGLSAGSPWKDRLVGFGQKRGILDFLRNVQPRWIHTSNYAYTRALHRCGVSASVLELFGNVPIVPTSRETARAECLRDRLGALLPASTRPDELFLVLTFGTLHPQWNPAATAIWIKAVTQRLQRKPAVILAGRAGAHAQTVRSVLQAQGISTVITGELDPAALSRLLQAADCGIAPHPWALIGKSGVAAAMREHGLPVVGPRDEWFLPGESINVVPPDPLLAKLKDLQSAEAVDAWLARRRAPATLLPAIVESFLQALRGC